MPPAVEVWGLLGGPMVDRWLRCKRPMSVMSHALKVGSLPLKPLEKPQNLGGLVVKDPPAKLETQVQSLGWEDSLEKELATHSSILVWRIPWKEEPVGLQSLGSQKGWT